MMIVTIPMKGVYLRLFRKRSQLFLPLDAANKIVFGEPLLPSLVKASIMDIIIVTLGKDPQLTAFSSKKM